MEYSSKAKAKIHSRILKMIKLIPNLLKSLSRTKKKRKLKKNIWTQKNSLDLNNKKHNKRILKSLKEEN